MSHAADEHDERRPNDEHNERPHDHPNDEHGDRPRRRRPPPVKPRGTALPFIIVGVLLAGFCGVGLLVALLLPAVAKVREASARVNEMNNLKQLALGMHNSADANQTFPPADGNLSWRVQILPYIEQQALYNQFDPKQRWDSPRNRPIADTRVKTLVSPLDPPETTQTHYRVFVGSDTIFEPGEEPLKLSEFKDGSSNTLLIVEATEMVPWPQPNELPFHPNGPFPPLGHPQRNVVLIAMADGSVRSVEKSKLTPTILKAIITPSGQDPVPLDW